MVDPTSPSNQLVGAVLNGRFKLLRLLGEGGMGAVFEADSLRGEGKFAIKMLHPEYTHDQNVLNRFFTEAQATQTLQHPHIARVFEAARAEDGTPYIVMEMLHGMPLAAFISRIEPIAIAKAVPIIHEVLQALTLAHARRIVHRDLKPDNIFLARDERGGFVTKVLDFGIAKVMDAAGGMGGKTRTGALLGTPGFMSPEQIKNSKAVDPRSDLWSVGAMFYEMVAGTEPFPADNDFARLTAVITGEVKPIEQVAPHLAAWGQFFRRALAKDLGARFQTAEEMDQSMMMLAKGGPSVPEWSVAPTPRAVPVAAPPAGAPRTPQTQAPVGVAHPSLGAYASASGASSASSASNSVSVEGLSIANEPSGVHSAKTGMSGTVAMAVQEQEPPQPSPLQMTVPLQTTKMPPRPSPALPGVPGGQVPISMVQSPQLAPMAGAPGAVVNTAVSAQKPVGAPFFSGPHSPPPVQIVTAPPIHPGPPWWVVGVIAFVCTALGFIAGLLASGG